MKRGDKYKRRKALLQKAQLFRRQTEIQAERQQQQQQPPPPLLQQQPAPSEDVDMDQPQDRPSTPTQMEQSSSQKSSPFDKFTANVRKGLKTLLRQVSNKHKSPSKGQTAEDVVMGESLTIGEESEVIQKGKERAEPTPVEISRDEILAAEIQEEEYQEEIEFVVPAQSSSTAVPVSVKSE